MKAAQTFFLLLAALFFARAAAAPMNVATFNMRLQKKGKENPEHTWETRKGHVAALIAFYGFDIFGAQEVHIGQVLDAVGEGGGYDYVGFSRQPGGYGDGEMNAVIYKKNRFDVLDSGVFWLSETPEIPSAGWDSKSFRICTWGKFLDKTSGTEFFFFNTHPSASGYTNRLGAAGLFAKKIPEIAGLLPAIFVGDFNANAESKSYKTITESGFLTDSRAISQTPPYGPNYTYNGFRKSYETLVKDGKPPLPIDHIFVTAGIRVLKHAVISDSVNGSPPSDHFPVMAKLEFPGE